MLSSPIQLQCYLILMKRICVYCGSSTGKSQDYVEAAKRLAASLVRQNLGLVYGGTSIGIMGIIADQVLALGGEAHGVIPKSLQEMEIAHNSLTELHVVESMHERKSMMASLADGFIAMPGGVGTLEEIIETLTWAQLRFHNKPCGLLNTNGYFDHLLAFLDHALMEGFLRQGHRDMLQVDDDPDALLRKFRSYKVPVVQKWVD